jgi:hypothetical protein
VRLSHAVVGADWAAWDLERDDGVRLEVKQSAATQTWEQARPSIATFDIRARTGRFEGATWFAEPGRAADLYVFAWHGRWGENVDQRDERQWEYFVVPTVRLPDAKTIRLGRLRAMCAASTSLTLRRDVDAACDASAVPSGRAPRVRPSD